MGIENTGQFNKAMNATLERNKSGKIEGSLVKTTVSKMTSMVNNATKINQKDSLVIKESKTKLAKNPKYQQEIYDFILRSALSKGSKGTEEYHANRFDKNTIKGLNESEVTNWTNQLNGGITKILQQGSVTNFQNTEKDIKTDVEDSKFNPQLYLNKILSGSDLGTLVSENLTNIRGDEAQKLLEAKRGDQDFLKGLGFAVLKEGSQSIQDVLMFFADILAIGASGGYVLTQYGYYRTRYSLTDNPEYKAKMDAMAENHPLLGLANMLTTSDGWSKLSELISSFGDTKQLTTQKIAIGITTIVGLIGGGVGLAKGLAGLTSKFAGKLPQLAKLGKVSNKVSNSLTKIGKVVDKVDNFVDPLGNATGALVGKVSGKLTKVVESPNTTKLITKDSLKQKYLSGSANDISDADRLADAQQLLSIELTKNQQEAIIQAHNVLMGNNVQKGKILRDAGFTEIQTRDLMETGVCGWFDVIGDVFSKKTEQPTKVNSLTDGLKAKLIEYDGMSELKGNKLEIRNLIKIVLDGKSLQTYHHHFVSWNLNDVILIDRSSGFAGKAKIIGIAPDGKTLFANLDDNGNINGLKVLDEKRVISNVSSPKIVENTDGSRTIFRLHDGKNGDAIKIDKNGTYSGYSVRDLKPYGEGRSMGTGNLLDPHKTKIDEYKAIYDQVWGNVAPREQAAIKIEKQSNKQPILSKDAIKIPEGYERIQRKGFFLKEAGDSIVVKLGPDNLVTLARGSDGKLVISGPGDNDLILNDSSVTLGRSNGDGLGLSDLSISREHANIEYDPVTGKLIISDLNSKNGVFVMPEIIKLGGYEDDLIVHDSSINKKNDDNYYDAAAEDHRQQQFDEIDLNDDDIGDVNNAAAESYDFLDDY